METQNIALALPKDTLLKVKLLAVQRGTSVSGLLSAELEKLVTQEEAYGRSQQRYLARLETAPDLSTGGQIDFSRQIEGATKLSSSGFAAAIVGICSLY